MLFQLSVVCFVTSQTKVEVVAVRPLKRQPGLRGLGRRLVGLQGGVDTSSSWCGVKGKPLIIEWFGDLALEHFWELLEICVL